MPPDGGGIISDEQVFQARSETRVPRIIEKEGTDGEARRRMVGHHDCCSIEGFIEFFRQPGLVSFMPFQQIFWSDALPLLFLDSLEIRKIRSLDHRKRHGSKDRVDRLPLGVQPEIHHLAASSALSMIA